MAKCTLCGTTAEIHKAGLCEGCFNAVKEISVKQKNNLEKLFQEAKQNPDQEHKDELIKEVQKWSSEMKRLKTKKIALDYKAEERLENEILLFCGLDPIKPKAKAFSVVSIVIVSALLLTNIATLLLYNQAKESAISWSNQAVALATQVDDLTAKIEKQKRTATAKKTLTLENGNFVSGVDFVAGTYDIKALSGFGNISSDDLSINAIMGTTTDDVLGIAQQKYENIHLAEGVTLTIDSVKVQLSLDEAD